MLGKVVEEKVRVGHLWKEPTKRVNNDNKKNSKEVAGDKSRFGYLWRAPIRTEKKSTTSRQTTNLTAFQLWLHI